jgi:hypothetical protein
MTRMELLAKTRPQVEAAVIAAAESLTNPGRTVEGLLMSLRVVDEGLTLLNRIDQEFPNSPYRG